MPPASNSEKVQTQRKIREIHGGSHQHGGMLSDHYSFFIAFLNFSGISWGMGMDEYQFVMGKEKAILKKPKVLYSMRESTQCNVKPALST